MINDVTLYSGSHFAALPDMRKDPSIQLTLAEESWVGSIVTVRKKSAFFSCKVKIIKAQIHKFYAIVVKCIMVHSDLLWTTLFLC